MSNVWSRQFVRTLAFASSLLFSSFLFLSLTRTSAAQLGVASPPAANSAAALFQGAQEDWTTPALAGSHLTPIRPLEFINDYPHYTLELLRVQWRAGDPIDLYVMKPKGVKKPPVILYLYGYPTDTEIFQRDEYKELVTKDGFAAVGFVSALTGHRYHDRSMKVWFVSELQESLATSAHDVQMVLNYLASRGDLDMDRVGMLAQGSGASIAILTSAVDPRIKVLEALEPWGDWPAWFAASPFVPADERAQYLTPDFLKKVSPLEPLDWLPRIQARKLRLENELFDNVTPPASKEKLRAAAPPGSSLVVYKTLDDFKAVFQDGKNLEWLHRELQALPNAAAPSPAVAPHP